MLGPLSTEQIDQLAADWQVQHGRPPDDVELGELVSAELDRQLLFREGLRRNLHLRDDAVRQRLILNMLFLQPAGDLGEEELVRLALRLNLHLTDEVVRGRVMELMANILLEAVPSPSAKELRARYESRRCDFVRPARYSLVHVLLNEQGVEDAIRSLDGSQLNEEDLARLGKPFFFGFTIIDKDLGQLSRIFGTSFAAQFVEIGPRVGTWLGPISSVYGQHLVWVREVEAEQVPAFEELEERLRWDLEAEARDSALRVRLGRLRERYRVEM